MSALLSVRNVSRSYDRGAAPAITVLRGVSFELAAGETLAISGPSGSGKSTLLQLCGTLDRPSSGAVLLDGVDLAGLDDDALARIRSREVGFVFQRHHLLPQCTALENVLVPALAWSTRADRDRLQARARSLLAEVGLSNRLDHKPGSLSGGECQRVAVARALLGSPKLLLADEPTGSLDRASADSLTDLLLGLNRSTGLALLVVTHSERLAAEMSHTRILEAGVLGDARSAA
jgi:predicted ABC-type transport system involved in lysophospholipase L1 biosynthesis ATPase subunit